jgi:hypothetical protein
MMERRRRASGGAGAILRSSDEEDEEWSILDFSPPLGIQEGSNQDPREIGTAGIVVESIVPGNPATESVFKPTP